MNTSTKEIANSVILGIIFMVLYSAFYTFSNLEELILNSIHNENPNFRQDGFTDLSLMYTSFALSIWFVPLLLSVLGPKWTLTLGVSGFCLPLLALILERGWLVYVSFVSNGTGAALVWTSQVVYLILNSTPATVARNGAIFAGICHSSMIYGNLLVYICFAGKAEIDKDTRTMILSGLLCLTLLSLVMSVFLPSPVYTKAHHTQGSALQGIRQSWETMRSKNMLMLAPMFIYTGVQLSYLSGVFGAVVGLSQYSDGFPSHQLASITGLCSGIGEIISGVFLTIINPVLSSRSWPLVVTLGIFSDCVAFLLSFFNYTNDSVFDTSGEHTTTRSRPWVAVAIAISLGFSDGLFMPMLLSLIKKMYPVENSSTSTVYTFWFSCGAAVSFLYSGFVGLYWQLLINSTIGIFGLLSYCYVNSITVLTSL